MPPKKLGGKKKPATPPQESLVVPPGDETVGTDDPTDELLDKGEALANEINPVTEPEIPEVAAAEPPEDIVDEPPEEAPSNSQTETLRRIVLGEIRPEGADIFGANAIYKAGPGKYWPATARAVRIEPVTGILVADLAFTPAFAEPDGHRSPIDGVLYGDDVGQWRLRV